MGPFTEIQQREKAPAEEDIFFPLSSHVQWLGPINHTPKRQINKKIHDLK